MLARAACWLVLTLGAPVAATAATPNPWWEGYEYRSEHVRVPDGRQMNLYCEGSGSPTIILDSGLGGAAWDWRFVQNAIAKETRVCSYDRAGIGGSDPGPLPRDTKAIVADMEAMLWAAGVGGPYVLVGHSLGSYDVRLFADRHLDQVAGMVLVDPATDHQNERFNAVLPKLMTMQGHAYDPVRHCLELVRAGSLKPGAPDYHACVGDPPPDMPKDMTHFHYEYGLSPNHYDAVLAELDATMRLNSDETSAARRSYRAMPLVVLTAGNNMGPPSLSANERAIDFKLWNQMHEEIAALSTRGVNRLVQNSGHYIQIEAPQAVIDAVDEVVREARAAKQAR